VAGLRPSRLTKHYPLKAVAGLRPATAFGVSRVSGRRSAGCEVIPVATMPARSDHPLTLESLPSTLPVGQRRVRPCRARVRFSLRAPVAFRAQAGEQQIRRPHTGNVVAVAGFQNYLETQTRRVRC
jgi:hypothetical protein